MGFDPPASASDPGNVGAYVYVDLPPGTCFIAGDTVEMTAPILSPYVGVTVVCRTYVLGNPENCAGFAVTNTGDVEGNAIVDGSASTPLFPDINTPAYRYGINLNAPLEYGIVMPRGIVNEAIGITTVAGHPGRIEWGGVATARLRPDTTTNDFW